MGSRTCFRCGNLVLSRSPAYGRLLGFQYSISNRFFKDRLSKKTEKATHTPDKRFLRLTNNRSEYLVSSFFQHISNCLTNVDSFRHFFCRFFASSLNSPLKISIVNLVRCSFAPLPFPRMRRNISSTQSFRGGGSHGLPLFQCKIHDDR
jgi:hypothetical protein